MLCQTCMTRKFVFLFVLSTFLISCDKDEAVKCENLAEALATNNQEAARGFFNQWIKGLSSKNYNQPNLAELVSDINADCSLTASLHCFDCIMTLPEQSEVSLSFQYNGNTITRYADFSRSADNKIIYLDFHE